MNAMFLFIRKKKCMQTDNRIKLLKEINKMSTKNSIYTKNILQVKYKVKDIIR